MRRSVVVLVVVVCAAGAVALVACGRTRGESDEGGGERCDPSRARQCVGDDVVACEADGTLGRRLQACHDGCDRGRCIASCGSEGAQLIYAVDTAHQLLSFDPRKLPGDPFRVIGKLGCEAKRGPYSMAVDRHGMAWIVYDDGELFQVSIGDASCERVAYDPGATELQRFGMGFVSDKPGGTSETLFLSSGDGSHALWTLDTSMHGDASARGGASQRVRDAGAVVARVLRPVRVGTLSAARERSPELTGTSEAQLFGFYPVRGQPSFIQEIDRATGAGKGRRWQVDATLVGEIQAWAFAQWAGVFYVFVTTRDARGELDSTVRAIDRATGRERVVRDHVQYRVTGAGVSTCAPGRER